MLTSLNSTLKHIGGFLLENIFDYLFVVREFTAIDQLQGKSHYSSLFHTKDIN